MKRLAILALLFAGVAPSPAGAQQMGYGQAEFLNSCAPCHGKDGQGNGPLTGELSRQPPDLTLLERKNGGNFPFAKVFATIDGNFMLPAHGERDMPVWGRQFLGQDIDDFGERAGKQVTEARIRELALYVETLQR